MNDQTPLDQQVVTQLEHLSHEAFLRADTETMDRILADDFVFTDPEGKVATKADWIAGMKSGVLAFESIRMDDLRVRIYGDAAVTFGRVTMKAPSLEAQYCYTAMYVKQNGRWQAVAEQANLLPAAQSED